MANAVKIVIMSSAAEEGVAAELAEADVCCANCGAAEVDDIKLEECDYCDLVKYCSDKCQEEHQDKHEKECENRVQELDELHDKELFTQPDKTHLGECPICFLPMPVDPRKSSFYPCCSELVCTGCVHANIMANIHDTVKAGSCPFCREPAVRSDDENHKRAMKRVKANDPVALRNMGARRYYEDDIYAAIEYWTKSAELGDLSAHYYLGRMYEGEGVEKDDEEAVYHYEKAAIGGHSGARYNLAVIEEENGNSHRAVKHLIIAANLGDEDSMKKLWKHYSAGDIAKEELDATLRTHQAAIDEMKSEQREVAEGSRALSS